MRFLKVLPLVLMLTSLAAETTQVYRDQYLIKSNVLGAALTSELDKAGAQVISKLNNGVSLVRPKVLSASSSQLGEIIDYKNESNYCHRLLKSGVVKLCSPNYKLKLYDTVSNDPYLPQLWGMSDQGIQATKAWDTTTGGDSVVVAVIDSGVDYNHPDLAANMWVNPFEVVNGIDDDRNGYVDDIHGVNTLANNGNPMDDFMHGTHCAGTIAAVGHNATGVVGVAWNAKIMALKFTNNQGNGSSADAVRAIDYAVDMKRRGVNVKVSSNSWGGPGTSDVLTDAIARANQAGIIFVAAAGNESSDNDNYPSFPSNADVENVVSVAAIDSNQNLASFSNYGYNTVDIAAPGVNILSTVPNGAYATLQGTSMATPHVAGALALLAGYNPELSAAELIKRLYETGSPKPALSGLIKTGRALNAYRLVTNQTIPLDQQGNKNYDVSEIGYNPDKSADSGSLIIQADEAMYEPVSLPFSFPFGNDSTRRIVVSPNGVIYFKNEPETWDYKNSSLAPIYSFAGFHTDLDSTLGGVRVKVSSNSVTVYWKATHYRYKSLGFLEVRTTLFSNGVIRTAIHSPSADLGVIGLGTIGITFADSTNSQALKANHNNYAVQFTPKGGSSEVPSVPTTGVSISSVKLGVKKISGYRSTKENLNLTVLGKGSGSVEIKAKFDNYSCSTKKSVRFNNGLKLAAPVSSSFKKFKTLTVYANQASSAVKLSRTSTTKKVYLARACRELFAGLK